jgi:membrane-associated phospholipid phosphatase
MSDSAKQCSWFPGWPHLRRAALLALPVLVVFCVVYGGTNYLAGGRAPRPVHFDAELRIPFVPAMTLVYTSMYGLFLLAPFLLRSEQELRALAQTLSTAILAAAVGFLLWPAEPAYPEPKNLGMWASLYQAADRLNLRYNMVPSLHVALSIATVSALARCCSWSLAVLLWSWGILISLSTLLTHQHHLLDVATGAALGIAVDRMVFRRLASSPARDEAVPATQLAEGSCQPIAGEQPSAQTVRSNQARGQTRSV